MMQMVMNLKTRSRNTQCISRATFIFLSIISHVFRFNVVVEIASSVLLPLLHSCGRGGEFVFSWAFKVIEVVNMYHNDICRF